MKFCVWAPQESDSRVSEIISALRRKFDVELVLGQGDNVYSALSESDLAISISDSDSQDAGFGAAARRQCIDLVVIVFADVSGDLPDTTTDSALRFEVREATFDADVKALMEKIDRHLQRISDARHEYNNIAAVVGLTANPVMLERAREALLVLRANYPEYHADPEQLDEKLGLRGENES